jgi:predicted nucleic acid-binding Zn ribbon protein
LPGRGLLSAAALIAIALACLTVTRKLERERRLLAKLRRRGAVDPARAISLDELSEDERDAAHSLAAAGVLDIRQKRCSIRVVEVGAFRRKRVRLMVMGGFGAFLLACLVAVLILRR